MTDHLTKEKRSWNMGRIKSKNTKPELILRSLLHKAGYRFRLNGKVSKKLYFKGSLPGKPDIVLAKYKTVIFVHGCFWHRHKNCKNATTPKTNTDYWIEKFTKNINRDRTNVIKLKELGWQTIIVWECELKNLKAVKRKIFDMLDQQQNIVYLQKKSDSMPAAAEKKENTYGY